MAILGLVGGAVLDIYSSGLSLLAAGVRIPRYAAAGIDGVLMTAGAVYIVFFSTSFIGQFEGFLTTLGVPISAWCGVILADLALRRRGYDEQDLFRPQGRYGDIRILPIATTVVGTVTGLGLGHQLRGGLAQLAGLPALLRSGSAASPAPGRTPTSACWRRSRSASSSRSPCPASPIREQEGQPGTAPFANEKVVQA